MSEKREFPCPRCREPVDWNAAPRWKPFCSERCRLIDLGAWLTEEHAIPGEPVNPAEPEDDQT